MLKTRVLLGLALALSAAALFSAALKPRPRIAPPGGVAVSTEGPLRLEARTSHTAVHAQGGELFTELTVTLTEAQQAPALPVSMALVLDRSGSMSGEKLRDAKRAAHRLVDLLDERDELGLVSFSSDVHVTALRRMDAPGKAALHEVIDAVEASGGTYISGGVQAGKELLQYAAGARRLVLVSDGRPTVGATQEHELVGLVGQVHDAAVTVTALGVGDDYDGLLMQHLAERGGGMYGYLQNAGALEEVLAREVHAARVSVLRNVVVELSSRHLDVLDVPGRNVELRGGRVALYLPDLRPNVPTTLYVRLRAAQASLGDVASLGARVRWESRLDDRQHEVKVEASVPVVDDAKLVEGSRDEAVYARGIKAVGGLQLIAAAAAYERGDFSAASLFLGNARNLFGMSADALAGEAEVERVRRDFTHASPEQRKALNLGLQKKLMGDFGKGGEGY